MEDVEIQKKGIIFIILADDMAGGFDLNLFRRSADKAIGLNEALPGKNDAVHICFLNSKSIAGEIFSNLIQFTLAAFKPLMKVRARIHKGATREEYLTKLQQFGIPTEHIPSSPNDNEAHTAFWTQRKSLERKTVESTKDQSECNVTKSEVNASETRVSFLGPSDVIFGRGYKINLHPGNIRYRSLIEDSKDNYDSCGRKSKTLITNKIVSAIKTKGRFLKADKYGWILVTDEAARLKVSHTFRDLGKGRTSTRLAGGGSAKKVVPEKRARSEKE